MIRFASRKLPRRPSLRRHIKKIAAANLAAAAFALPLAAQTQQQVPPQPQTQSAPQSTQPEQPATPITPGATVLFERSTPPPETAPPQSETPPPTTQPAASYSAQPELNPGQDDPLHVTDAERESITFTRYDLDLHLSPATSALTARAGLTVRNDGPSPLTRIALQLTSTAHWEAVSTIGTTGAAAPLNFTARRVATDADHTGWASEAVITLPQPLAPGASLPLIALYSGTAASSAERLERIGAPADQAASADWDGIGFTDSVGAAQPLTANASVALRGFGNVLWYPVAAMPVFLGDGAKLFDAVARARRRDAAATIHLRLAVEFAGDPPDAAFFCGRREPLKPLYDDPSAPIAQSTGLAAADFAPIALGPRTLSLFVTTHPSTPAGTPARNSLIAAVTNRYDALAPYSAAAAQVEPLLTDWFGPQPLAVLNLIDHPGQPFEDGTLLVRPFSPQTPKELAPTLAHSLTHAWIGSGSRPLWIDEGLAEFAELLWFERSEGREAALARMQDAARALALAEPAPASSASPPKDPTASNQPQPLTTATSDIYFRTKAASVWWMLRSLASDDALKQAIQAYRTDPKLDADPEAFERTLERFARKDLRWFFDNWVYNDRGLPDLSIASVTPRRLEAHNGLPAGWLVAVEMRNDGDAEAEVPLTIRSAIHVAGEKPSITTERIRIPPHTMLSRRIVFPGTPGEVQLNDGSVPELGVNVHTHTLNLAQ